MTYVLVIGSINMDLVVETDRMPVAGETISGNAFNTIPGGKGANQAVAASRMGADVRMVGAIGDDSFGEHLKNSLSDSGVDVAYVVQKEKVSTGTATIIVDQTGDNRIIVVPGANGKLLSSDIVKIEKLIAEAAMVLIQFEIPMGTINGISNLAENHSVPVICNPAPAYPISDSFLKKIKYLVVNEIEVELLSGIAVSDVASGFQAAQILQNKGAEVVIVTLGKQGAILVNSEQEFHIPAFQVNVIDTTAAGDTFVGAFAAACTQGKEYREAVTLAVNAGTLAVTILGAQPSIPTIGEVHEFTKKFENVLSD
jgi:ribokinase